MTRDKIDQLTARVERQISVAKALFLETDYKKVLELILEGAQLLTEADAATLYLYEKYQLRMTLVRTKSLGLAMGGEGNPPVDLPNIPLYDEVTGKPRQDLVVAYAVNNGVSVRIDDAYAEAHHDFSGTKLFDEWIGYRSRAFLTIPMTDQHANVIGVLQLINPIDSKTKQARIFTEFDQRLAEDLALKAAFILRSRRKTQEMFAAFVQFIIQTIETKSPHTGEHCKRVPILTMLLADAAHAKKTGPLKDFFLSIEDREALELAAWLHDCGKIITPEAVINKSTKLETTIDRISIVNVRLEMLAKEAKVHALEQWVEANGGNVASIVAASYSESLNTLKQDRDFLEKANQGSERMSEADQQRIEALAKKTWIDMEGIEQPLLTENEVYNLNIAKGTLTPEERQVMENHIVASIDMLEALSFPPHLQAVPEYAGGHHERMDGKGYPKGLTRDEMSVPARIMGIADIFEALTAKRPYKEAMPLSQALNILKDMSETGHIDPDLYQIFIKEKVYMTYAKAYLTEKQIDRH